MGFYVIPYCISSHDYENHLMWHFQIKLDCCTYFPFIIIIIIIIILGETSMNWNCMESYGLLAIYTIMFVKVEHLFICVNFN